MTVESQLQRRKPVSLFTRVFRLVFIIFSLYLMGDAFSRWDGFRLHSSFLDFLPNVGLAFIIWTALSLLVTVLIWLVCTAVLVAGARVSKQIKSEHLFINTVLLLALGLIVWAGKKYFFSSVETSVQLKVTVLFITMGVSIVITMLLRDAAVRWTDSIHDRITPLVWLFSLFFIISVSLAGYQFVFSENSNGSEHRPSPVAGSGNARPNVILVTFDTLTARDMSVYGYGRPTTPFISEWAKKATVFTNVQAESNWTPPTTASLMTGMRVWTHNRYHRVDHSKTIQGSVLESLPAELRKHGYYNVAFVQNKIAHPKHLGIVDDFDIAPGYAHFVKPTTLVGWSFGALDVFFDRYFGEKFALNNWMISQDFILGQILYRISGALTQTPFPAYLPFNEFLEMFDRKLPEPFFAWIHIWPPHDHFMPPEPFMGTFDQSEKLRVYPGNMIPAVKSDDFLRANVDVLRARYNEFILYCDKQFEKFILSLEERQLTNTLIVLSSDHGESFEHDYYSHGGRHLYEQVTHVPLMIKEPRQNEGKVIHVLSEQIDIPATILEISGLPVPGWMEGRSLLPVIRGEHLDPRPAFSMNLDSSKYGAVITSGTFAVWDGDYKLIHYLEEGKNLLFNLREDRDELDNLYEKRPELGKHLLGLIRNTLKRQMKNWKSRQLIMVNNEGDISKTGLSYWRIFRVVLVIFSLYLIGDAFSRWDGFSYYASFSEFLPSVALAFVLWSIVAALVGVLLWLSFRIVIGASRMFGLKIAFDDLFLYTGFFILLGAFVWGGKKLLWPDLQTAVLIKLTAFFFVAVISVILTLTFRIRSERWNRLVQDRIAPLVWLFGVIFVVSTPLVCYHTWIKQSEEVVYHAAAEVNVINGNKPNFILVTFDALAARNMSVYGYHRETTPYISQWARKSTLFTRAEAASNFTTPTVASLMTGKRVWTHQTYHVDGARPVKSDTESLPYILKQHGYFNIALVVNPFASASVLGMSDSFDIAPPINEFGTSASLFGWKFGIVDKFLYRMFGEKIRLHNWIIKNDFIFSRFINFISRNITQTTVPPEKVFNRFLNIMDNHTATPFFAWIHVFPPHDPYLPPQPFRREINSSSKLRSYKEQEKLIEESYRYLFQYKPFPDTMETSVYLMRDDYDGFIKYIDKTFENFVGELNKRHMDNTAIILTADHGESFEHGYFTHGGPFLYEEVTHIPLIIKEPLQDNGKVVNTLVEQIDIPATILNLANISPPSWMEGRSLLPLMRGEHLINRPAFTMNFQENRSRGHEIKRGSIAVWDGDYKLIHYLGRDESLLFNLKRDHDETDNIFHEEGEVGRRLIKLIKANLETANKKIKSGL